MTLTRMRYIALGFVLMFSLALFAGCSSKTEEDAPAEPHAEKQIVAVSIVPQQTFVEAVCGDLAEVVVMVPPGNSPGNYEPTPQQMEQLHDAAIYFTIGIPTETANILPEIQEVQAVSLQDAVSSAYPDREFASGSRDPHIWLSPKRAEVMVQIIADELSKLDPENKDSYQSNAEAYKKQLQELDREIVALFEQENGQDFIVYHPSFGYFAEDYGLTMHALQQGGKDATPERLQDIIDLAKERNIKAIYIQQEIDSSQAQAFAEEIEGTTIQLSPLSGDYIQNLRTMANTIAENIK